MKASLCKRQELKLVHAEAKAWEEAERDPTVLEDSLSTKLSSVSNIAASMYTKPGPPTCHPDDAQAQPNPNPDKTVTVNRCPASVLKQSKMVPSSMPSLNALHPTSCSQKAVAAPSSVVTGEQPNNVFASQVLDVLHPDNSLSLFQQEKQALELGTLRGMLLGKK